MLTYGIKKHFDRCIGRIHLEEVFVNSSALLSETLLIEFLSSFTST